MTGLNEMIATVAKVIDSTKGNKSCFQTGLCYSGKCPFQSEVGVEGWRCVDWTEISCEEKIQKRKEWLARAKTWVGIGEQQARADIDKQYLSPLSRFLAKARLVDIEAEKTKKKAESEAESKSWTPITKFEVGKWYRYHGKERPSYWASDGRMDYALDGTARQCLRVGEKPYYASFLPTECTHWSWRDGFELWEEVPAPTKSAKEMRAEAKVAKSKTVLGMDEATIYWGNVAEHVSAALDIALHSGRWHPDSNIPSSAEGNKRYHKKVTKSPRMRESIHCAKPEVFYADTGVIQSKQIKSPKFTKRLDLGK